MRRNSAGRATNWKWAVVVVVVRTQTRDNNRFYTQHKLPNEANLTTTVNECQQQQRRWRHHVSIANRPLNSLLYIFFFFQRKEKKKKTLSLRYIGVVYIWNLLNIFFYRLELNSRGHTQRGTLKCDDLNCFDEVIVVFLFSSLFSRGGQSHQV